MTRTLPLIAMSLLVAFVLLPGAVSPAPVQGEEAGPLYPLGPVPGIPLVCPNVVDLKDDLEEVIPHEEGYTVYEWFLKKGLSPYPTETIAHGTDKDLFYRDWNVEPGKVYYYGLDTYWEGPGQPWLIPVIYQPVHVTEACAGLLYEDLTFGAGVHNLGTLVVKEDAVLQIEPMALVRPYQGPSAYIDCEGEQAQVQINGGEFVSITVRFLEGGGWVRDARFAPGAVYVYGEVKGILVIGITFTGEYSSYWSKIGLQDSSSALIEGNRGRFQVYLRGQSQSTIRNNTFEGGVTLEEESKARIENSHITGAVNVNGYWASPGLEARATLISSTIVLADTTFYPPPSYALRVQSDGHLTAIRSRLNCLRSHVAYCPLAYIFGADMTIQRSWIVGVVTAQTDAEIDLCDNKLILGRIRMEDESVGHVVRNPITGTVEVRESADLTFTDNVVSVMSTEDRILIEGEAKGEFQRNTFKGSSYAFVVSGGQPHPHPDLTIEHNCIESTTGLLVHPSRPTTLTVENNWWGDESGPRHYWQNPEGLGAYISGDKVDFKPYLQSPFYDGTSLCRDTPPPPPPMPVVASAAIGPQGGTLYTPDDSARLVFPPGAVAQTTVVTYSQTLSSPTGDLSAGPFFHPATATSATTPSPTGDLAGVRFFDLSAVISGTTTPVTSFSKPYTLTINYTDAERGAAIESTLGLYWWDEGHWVWEPTSSVYPAEDRCTATPDHMTLFAVLGETNRVYLPLILRNQ